jgi:hypothetical protein
MVKCLATLPKIPKHVAFNAVADLNVRKKWDDILASMTIVEEDKLMDTIIFHYTIPTPAFITMREALVMRKTLKDFPIKESWAIHHKSCEHKDWPENENYIRVDLKINGMIFEDDPETQGCKLYWIIQNDIKGSVPKSIIN